MSRLIEVFLVALRLGLTSFGGPVAHLGYFRDEYVRRRRWLDDSSFADLVALCQFLPGPASSQVGIGVGISRAGLAGGLAAWLGFTLPSAAIMILIAYGVSESAEVLRGDWLRGLKVAAVAVVALAVWGMAKTLAPDRLRITFAVAGAAMLLFLPSASTQVAVIALAALAGVFLVRGRPPEEQAVEPVRVSKAVAVAALVLFALLLVALPAGAVRSDRLTLDVVDSFYRAGSLVFGGGHVVLPLLEAEVVPRGWVSEESFVAGYGAAQAIPGPLFTFSGYLGASIDGWTSRWIGGLVALGAVFLPSFLLVAGALPFWEWLRRSIRFRSALAGINAAVVGLLLAALYDPVWTSAINGPADVALGLAAFALLAFWKWPAWLVVLATAAGGATLAYLS